jgi:hypothetical protein
MWKECRCCDLAVAERAIVRCGVDGREEEGRREAEVGGI